MAGGTAESWSVALLDRGGRRRCWIVVAGGFGLLKEKKWLSVKCGLPLALFFSYSDVFELEFT